MSEERGLYRRCCACLAPGLSPHQLRVLIMFGLGYGADGMEMYVMSLILPELPASWNMNADMRGLLGGSTFMGMSVGTLLFGMLSDRYGRIPILRTTIALALLFGTLSAFSPSFAVLLTMRILFGMAVGGYVPVGSTHLIETCPPHVAGMAYGLSCNFFSVGAVFTSLIAIPIVPHLGYNWLIFFSAVPLFIPMVGFFWPGYVLESPPWLRESGRHAEADLAEAEIRRIDGDDAADSEGGGAHCAKTAAAAKLAQDRSRRDGPAPSFGEMSQRLCVRHARLSAVLFPMWACMSFGYYGLVYVLPTHLKGVVPSEIEFACITLTAVVEIPGNWFGGWMADKYGRKLALNVNFGCACVMAVATGLTTLPGVGWGWLLLCCCFLKVFLMAAFAVIFVYTMEAYPTLITNFGLGAASTFTRLAGALTPYVGQEMLDKTSGVTTFMVYAAGSGLAFLLSVALPFETLGRNADTIEAERAEASPLIKGAKTPGQPTVK